MMICYLMSPSHLSAQRTGQYVKVFLSCCNSYAKEYYAEGVTPFWACTGNFPSLLNLEEQIVRYGPLLWYWEGTCERFIQAVKRVLTSMRTTTSFFSRKLTVIQKLNVMDWLRKSLRRKERTNHDYRRMYYRYSNIAEVEEKFNRGLPVSAFSMDGYPDLLFVAYGKHGPKMSCVAVLMDTFDTDSKSHCGLDYGSCTLDTGAIIADEPKKDFEAGMSDYCLLLPDTSVTTNQDEKRYAVVYHDWDVWNCSLGKSLPVLKENLFT